MKFTIEIEDFWTDEDSSSVSDELKDYIIKDLFRQVKKHIDNELESKVYEVVRKKAEDYMNSSAMSLVDEILKKEMIPNPKRNEKDQPEQISVNDYIKYKFIQDAGWSNNSDRLKKLADQFGKEIKDRYDLLFASQIVSKLNGEGLLKDDIAKLLLPSGD